MNEEKCNKKALERYTNTLQSIYNTIARIQNKNHVS